MNAKQVSMIGLFIIAIVALTGLAGAIPVAVQKVEIDHVTVLPNAVNRLDIERGNEVNIRVELMSTDDLNDVEILGIMTGYEFNDIATERLTAQRGPFDMKANVTYNKKLTITLPNDVEVDTYKLRLIISDRDGTALSESYNLLIDTPRHDVSVTDVIFTPHGRVMAGAAMLTTVRVENNGQRTEDSVKVTVSIPDLGVAGSDFIESIDADDQEETEEIYFRLPECAEPGVYDAKIDVWYNDGRKHTDLVEPVMVLENPRCNVVVEPTPPAPAQQAAEPAPAAAPAVEESHSEPATSTLRKMLETVLLILLALLVVVGLIVGFSKLAARSDDE